jgi:hypothetical protein
LRPDFESGRQLDGVIGPQHVRIGEERRPLQQGDGDLQNAVILGEVLAELIQGGQGLAGIRAWLPASAARAPTRFLHR